MYGIEHIYSFIIAATLVIIIPGPATFYIAAKAHLSALKASYATIGIVMGDIILITLSGLGFSSLITKWPILLSMIKLTGAVYIAYLGWGLLRTTGLKSNQNLFPSNASKTGSSFTKGILITLTNPKPILFFSAFFPIFINAKTKSWMQIFYLLGSFFEIMNLCYFALIILIISGLRRMNFLNVSITEQFNKIIGYGLIFFSVFILIFDIYKLTITPAIMISFNI